ncbi:MAG: hypothetical protein ACE5HJ_08330 [Thermoplasmata archaeon]
MALAAQTSRKALDLLHLAAGRFGRQVLGLPLEAFVTADGDLIQAGPCLHRLLGFPVENPTSFLEGIGP